jgi:hypothetical protein
LAPDSGGIQDFRRLYQDITRSARYGGSMNQRACLYFLLAVLVLVLGLSA